MFYVVAYDIADNRRRTRLFKALKGFGLRCQYSVFECELDSRQLDRLLRVVGKIVRASDDNVRVYPLCGTCLDKVSVIGGALNRTPRSFIV